MNDQLHMGFEPARAPKSLSELAYLRRMRPALTPPTCREDKSLYEAVTLLREVGHVSVYRAGPREHLVGGEIMSTPALKRRLEWHLKRLSLRRTNPGPSTA